jgi:hypothetical protein
VILARVCIRCLLCASAGLSALLGPLNPYMFNLRALDNRFGSAASPDHIDGTMIAY